MSTSIKKRAERRAQLERVVARRERAWRLFNDGDPPNLKALHPWSCGKARCWLCHHEKLAGKPLPRDIRANAAALADNHGAAEPVKRADEAWGRIERGLYGYPRGDEPADHEAAFIGDIEFT